MGMGSCCMKDRLLILMQKKTLCQSWKVHKHFLYCKSSVFTFYWTTSVILYSLYFSFSILGHLTLYSTNSKERVSLFNKNEKKKKFHTTRTIPNSNIKIVERDKFDIPNIPNTWPLTFLAWYKHFNQNYQN